MQMGAVTSPQGVHTYGNENLNFIKCWARCECFVYRCLSPWNASLKTLNKNLMSTWNF